MLCSYGFILQLRRSPTPCCVGNGTLVTRVHRVQLTREQQAAGSRSMRASSFPHASRCRRGLFDLWCLRSARCSHCEQQGCCMFGKGWDAGCTAASTQLASHRCSGLSSLPSLLCREDTGNFCSSPTSPTRPYVGSVSRVRPVTREGREAHSR